MAIENSGYTSIDGAIFRDAISREMESRGYVKSGNPDLMINVSGKKRDRTRVTPISDPSIGGYYGYRWGHYGVWGDYGNRTSTHVSRYREGTINVDLVDRDRKHMVWEGIAIGRINEKESNDQKRESIFASVQEMFAAYPFRAGR
jgi:hypothetical protein